MKYSIIFFAVLSITSGLASADFISCLRDSGRNGGPIQILRDFFSCIRGDQVPSSSNGATYSSNDNRANRKKQRGNARIVGGYETTIEDVPYVVLLDVRVFRNIRARCAGSIISKRYILTAAHCIQGVQEVTVRAGSTKASDGEEYKTSQLIVHPQYISADFINDIGLIQLDRDIDINNRTTRIVQLLAAGTAIIPNTTLLIAGWGVTSEFGFVSSTLKAVKLPTVSQQECKRTEPDLTDMQFCAGVREGGKDSCQGDSGGPAVNISSGEQLGIVSYGNGCGRPGEPGVYTNVGAYRDWIKNNSGV